MATNKKDVQSSKFARNNSLEEFATADDLEQGNEGLNDEISAKARRQSYKQKRALLRRSVEIGAEQIFKKAQHYEPQGEEKKLVATLPQLNVRAPREKIAWASNYMTEMVNEIDKELYKEGFVANGGSGNKSSGKAFVLNAVLDLIIVLKDDEEDLELPEGFHDWLESLRGYIKSRRKNTEFHK